MLDTFSEETSDSDGIDINLIDLAKICAISYSITNNVIYKPKENEKDLFEKISDSILSIECNLKNIQAMACITKDENVLIISIAGSNDVQDFLYNLDSLQISPYDESRNFISKDIRFHKGFYIQFMDMLKNLLDIINDFKRKEGQMVILCGHSMGGCIASICAFYLKNLYIMRNIKVVTFGTPIFTNPLGAKWFEEHIDYTRVELDKDPIPKLPIDVRYSHVEKSHIYIKNSKIIFNNNNKENCFSFIKKLFKKKLDLKYHDIYEYIKQINL